MYLIVAHAFMLEIHYTLSDDDECERLVPCHGGICMNSPGSYTCSCPIGFELDVHTNTCKGGSCIEIACNPAWYGNNNSSYKANPSH